MTAASRRVPPHEPRAPVRSVTATPIAIPYRRPLALATGTAREHCAVVVELRDEDGCVGSGEIAPGPGAAREEVTAIARWIEARGARLAESGSRAWHDAPPATRIGIETAALDLRARQSGTPLHGMLSGVPVSSHIHVNCMVDRSAPDEARRAVDDALSAGFRCLKVKLDPRHLEDCEAVLRYARRRRPDVVLRIDCNGQWSRGEALRGLRRLEALEIDYVEQPVADIEDLRALRRATSVRIAADESASDFEQIDRIVAVGAADVIVLKPARLGLIGSVRAAALAQGAGIECVVTSNLESSLGVAAAVHVAAVIDARSPDRPLAHGLATVTLLDGDIVDSSLLPAGGAVRVPQGVGCGVTLLAGRLEKFAIGTGEARIATNERPDG